MKFMTYDISAICNLATILKQFIMHQKIQTSVMLTHTYISSSCYTSKTLHGINNDQDDEKDTCTLHGPDSESVYRIRGNRRFTPKHICRKQTQFS